LVSVYLVIPALIIASVFLNFGCATVAPGNDPIVVNAERVESSAIAAFDLVVNVDNVNRPFWKTNAPPFHAFVEWLRAPQTFQVTNIVPRGSALVLSLHQVKIDYKASRVSSNLLVTATSTLLSAVNQANSWLAVTTNATVTPTP